MTTTPPAKPRVVLLIDDNRETRDLYARALEEGGFSPLHVRSPLDGLKAAREFQPDAIVTAMVFPGPMDGLALTRQLRLDPRTSRLKIVILTGRDFNTDREAARRAGCDLYLTKPCPADVLVSALQSIRPELGSVPTVVDSGLAWSRRGEVACADHAPERDSERWQAESWRVMPSEVAHGRIQYQCQHCAVGPIAHRRQRPTPAPRLAERREALEARMSPPSHGGADLRNRVGPGAASPGRAHLAPKD